MNYTTGRAKKLAGRKGGKAAAKRMTAEQRTTRARKAGLARQAKRKRIISSSA